MRIFVSFASADRKLASTVVDFLKQEYSNAGPLVFVNAHDLPSGEDWRESVRARMQQANQVVIVDSDHAETSGSVNYEAGLANALGKEILLVSQRGAGRSSLSHSLARSTTLQMPRARAVQGLKQSAAQFFADALDWLAASSLGMVLYFSITWDTTRLLWAIAIAFALLITSALRRVRLRDPRNAPRTLGGGGRTSKLAYIAANALTLVRPAIGIAAGISMANGLLTWGFVLFLAGLTSDVLDGLIARMFEVESAHGREWDAIADVIHNFAFGLGLAWFAFGPPQDIPRLSVLGGMVLIFIASRFLIGLHTVADKVLSGMWRVVLFVLAYSLLPADWTPAALIGGAILGAVGGVYEVGVLHKEKRRWY